MNIKYTTEERKNSQRFIIYYFLFLIVIFCFLNLRFGPRVIRKYYKKPCFTTINTQTPLSIEL